MHAKLIGAQITSANKHICSRINNGRWKTKVTNYGNRSNVLTENFRVNSALCFLNKNCEIYLYFEQIKMFLAKNSHDKHKQRPRSTNVHGMQLVTQNCENSFYSFTLWFVARYNISLHSFTSYCESETGDNAIKLLALIVDGRYSANTKILC